MQEKTSPMDNNNEIVIISISITVLTLLLCSFIVFFVVRYKQRQREHEKEKELIRVQYEREGNKAKLELYEHTMRSISEEIHDNVGHALSLAKLQINTMTMENMPENCSSAGELLTGAIQDLRNMGRSLNGNYILEHGLEKSIIRELELLKASVGMDFHFESHLNGYHIKEGHEVILFRCVQETLNNAMKYADATMLEIALTAGGDRLKLMVNDNGKGFDTTTQAKGLGLRNITSRAEILKGQCTIESKPGKGTRVLIDIPLHYSIANAT
ncbi:MAG: sensor histidine kinase [Flavobacteriales bacterium]